jgi:heme exporter protein A
MRLIADNLGGERGGQPVFGGIDFELGDGESLTITGPNGAGKSTLLRIVAGLLQASSGSVRIEGGDFDGVSAACHYLGHLNAMKPALTVTENLRFWQEFSGEPRLGVQEALEAVDLGSIGYLPFGALSTGQRRRAAIAKLLVSFRPVWLLDEPTSGLDKTSEARFFELMQAHLMEGGIILAATHLPLGLRESRLLEMGERGDDV